MVEGEPTRQEFVVARSDLEKIYDALSQATDFFKSRDAMNASVHMAPTVRYSPLTSSCEAEKERLQQLLGLVDVPGASAAPRHQTQ